MPDFQIIIVILDLEMHTVIFCNKCSALTNRRKKYVTNHLASIGIYPADIGKIEKEMQSILAILDNCLNNTDFFFSNNLPTELDALVFGHVFALLTTKGVDGRIPQLVHQFQNLVNFSMNINEIYFKNDS